MRLAFGLGAFSLLCGVALAQSSGGPYVMRKDVIANGGATASAATYRATVTVAQPAAAAAQVGESYVLTGGFHSPAAASAGRIFCDGFEDAPCL